MKKNKIIDAIGLADEKYIAEAAPSRGRAGLFGIKRTVGDAGPYNGNGKNSNRRKLRFAAIAAALALVLGAALFVPFRNTPPSVKKYADSEYYGIIEKLNKANFAPPQYRNGFDAILQGADDLLDGMFLAKAQNGADRAPGDAMATGGQNYAETTDNQVSGVIEADLVKRSDKYIYYLNAPMLYVYSIDGESSETVAKYRVADGNGKYYYYEEWELYLSEDCNTVTVIAPGSVTGNGYPSARVEVISLDVSDPESISEKGRASVSGGYISSRLVNGDLLLITEFYAGDADFSDESTFVPQINTGDGAESIPADCIISPEVLTSSRYTVVCRFDEGTLELEDKAALLSYSDEVYVSAERVYAVRQYREKLTEDDVSYYVIMTEISCVDYGGEKFVDKGCVQVEGYIKDQYSLDEYNGMLRIVTTTSNTFSGRSDNTNEFGIMIAPKPQEFPITLGTSASLYIVDIGDFTVLQSVKYFAPVGETVRSVRFDGTAAYVCTAVQQTDPVFFFDLSDINNIKVKDTGTISGFSTSLVNMGNGFLLGIGRGESWNSVKVEVYEEAAKGVRSVAVYEKMGASYAEDYKAYLIDRKNGLVGLGITFDYTAGEYSFDDQGRYVLLHFNGYDLVPLVNTSLDGDDGKKRGIIIEDLLYLLCETGDMKVVSLSAANDGN